MLQLKEFDVLDNGFKTSKKKYSAKLDTTNAIKIGWLCYSTITGELRGLLDENRLAIWYIDITTIKEIEDVI